MCYYLLLFSVGNGEKSTSMTNSRRDIFPFTTRLKCRRMSDQKGFGFKRTAICKVVFLAFFKKSPAVLFFIVMQLLLLPFSWALVFFFLKFVRMKTPSLSLGFHYRPSLRVQDSVLHLWIFFNKTDSIVIILYMWT